MEFNDGHFSVISADVVDDQCYAYRILKMITTGVFDHDLLQLKIGEVSHSRWLTTGNRFARQWVSKHGFKGAT